MENKRLYLIKNNYDDFDHSGGVISQQEVIGTIQGLENAKAYCEKYSRKIITCESARIKLFDGKLTFEEIPQMLNPNVQPFHAEKDEYGEYEHLVWHDNRFI